MSIDSPCIDIPRIDIPRIDKVYVDADVAVTESERARFRLGCHLHP
jgi:hypothetical protein